MIRKSIGSIEELNHICKNEHFYIYGAGKVAYGIIRLLMHDGYKLEGVLVSNRKNNPDEILGNMVMEISEKTEITHALLICTRELYHDELWENLKNTWKGNIYFVEHEVYKYSAGFYNDFELENRIEIDRLKYITNQKYANLLKFVPKPCFQYMVVNICDHCNLKCKGCDHFACIADSYYVDYEVISNDLERLSTLFKRDYIMKIAVMGGEPLLHPDLNRILAKVRECFPYAQIRLTTNGLLLLRQDYDFWKTLRDNNITIVNTKYPIGLDYDKIKKKAQTENVAFMHYEGTDGTFVRRLQKHSIDLDGKSDPTSRFARCHVANYGNFLMEGKMYGCPFACQAYRIFNKKFDKNLRMTENDYLDIYKVEDMQEFFEFAARPKYFCRYCAERSEDYNWERSSQNIEEWL